jgi:hypothetical protein
MQNISGGENEQEYSSDPELNLVFLHTNKVARKYRINRNDCDGYQRQAVREEDSCRRASGTRIMPQLST